MSEVKAKEVLTVGMFFKHEYDFGSTTTLKLTVMDKYRGASAKDPITLPARNEIEDYRCSNCGKKAEYACMENEYGDFTYLCEDCVDKFEDDDLFIFRITNSPRMGVCGYEGELDTYQLY
ncbi:hypothetical protein [Clostridium oryzae]|uniref:Uncharacterized protein n=1 Tax=Clostridium oryzae TaxID=1450648 RepID=A0A1V4ISC5_9CLOT|nr:hypothetical protein [Clostridium oryzae]OPJ62928.1 hypothetical protein CLORY_15520 [Clostridium oryzae]